MSSVAEEGDYVEYSIPTYEFVEDLITADDNTISEVEYLEDEENMPVETLEGHTIFLHEGKQYLIPNELSQIGKTILLQNEDGKLMEIVINSEETETLNVLDNQEHLIIDNENVGADELTELLSGASDKCYMVLENGEVDLDATSLESEQLAALIEDGQLQFEATDLTSEQLRPDNDESSGDMEQVVGKNLITGETITLSGLFSKIKKNNFQVHGNKAIKQETDFLDNNITQQHSESSDSFDASQILNRKIPVGTSTDGKKIYGRILEIRKKDDPNLDFIQLPDDELNEQHHIELRIEGDASMLMQQNENGQEMDQQLLATDAPLEMKGNGTANSAGKIEELLIDNTGKILKVTNSNTDPLEILGGNAAKNSAPAVGSGGEFGAEIPLHKLGKLDHTTAKTLTGLMELETVQKRLLDKYLMVKVVKKKLTETGVKKTVTYLFGSMECDPSARNAFHVNNTIDAEWTFKLDPKKHPEAHGHEHQALDPTRLSLLREADTVTLSIVEDMNGSQKTKVSIPNLGVGSTKCNICQKNFKAEQHLKRHMLQHTKPKNAVCEVCDKCFLDNTALMRHKRIHTGDLDYECPICHKQFNSHGSLRRHITVHNPSLRPLQCLTCYQRFTDESSLKKHMLIHTGVKPFNCDYCDKNFVNQGDLNFHKRIHDPTKRFNCETCGKDFSRYSNLTRHREIHKGSQAAYTCNICGCSYNFVSSLTRHLVTNHIKPGTS